jgi:hypothetical protein
VGGDVDREWCSLGVQVLGDRLDAIYRRSRPSASGSNGKL